MWRCKKCLTPKIEKLELQPHDSEWIITCNNLMGNCSNTRDQVLMMKLNEIIDYINKEL